MLKVGASADPARALIIYELREKARLFGGRLVPPLLFFRGLAGNSQICDKVFVFTLPRLFIRLAKKGRGMANWRTAGGPGRLAGKPFVGPAGQIMNRAQEETGINARKPFNCAFE